MACGRAVVLKAAQPDAAYKKSCILALIDV